MSRNTPRLAHTTPTTQPSDVRSVLVADDDADIREALRVILEDEGYAVLEAADGIETLKLLRSAPPLIALLDVIMPHMSGFEVLMRALGDDDLRERHAYIILTAERMSSPRIGPHFAELVDHHQIPIVAKPFQLDDLLAAVAAQARRLASDSASARLDRRDSTGA